MAADYTDYRWPPLVLIRALALAMPEPAWDQADHT